MKNNKGITLISLVSSILLLFILAATTVATSMNAYKQMKFEGAKAELEEVQKLVDEIASDYQTYLSEKGNTTLGYSDYFNDRYNENKSNGKTTFDNMKINSSSSSDKIEGGLKSAHPEVDANPDVTFYFSENDLTKYFGLKGIEEVIVNFSTRKVYSVKGIKDSSDNTKVYYTPEDWGAKIVEKTNGTTEYTVGISSIVRNGTTNNFDVEIVGTGTNTRISNKITEVYFKSSSGSYIKIDNFRDLSNETLTKIRVSINTPVGKYSFRLVDELNNFYDSPEKDLK